MANFYIWEFSESRVRNRTQIPGPPTIVQQSIVPIAIGSNQSAPFSAATSFITVTTDEDCWIAIGTNPVATLNSYIMLQSTERSYGVNPGDQIAVIANAASTTPANGYVAEDGATFYVAEDGATFYVQEH